MEEEGTGRARGGARSRRGDVGASGSGRVRDRHGRDSCSVRWSPRSATCRKTLRPDDPPGRESGPARGPLRRPVVGGLRSPDGGTPPRRYCSREHDDRRARPAAPRGGVVRPRARRRCLPGRVGVARRDQHRRRADRSRHRLRLPGGRARAGARRLGHLGPARAAGRRRRSRGRRRCGGLVGRRCPVRMARPRLRTRLGRHGRRVLVRGPLRGGAAVRPGGRAAALPDRDAPRRSLAGDVGGRAAGVVRPAARARPRARRRRLHHARAGCVDRGGEPSDPGRSRGGHAAGRAGAHPRVDRGRRRAAVGPPPTGRRPRAHAAALAAVGGDHVRPARGRGCDALGQRGRHHRPPRRRGDHAGRLGRHRARPSRPRRRRRPGRVDPDHRRRRRDRRRHRPRRARCRHRAAR